MKKDIRVINIIISEQAGEMASCLPFIYLSFFLLYSEHECAQLKNYIF